MFKIAIILFPGLNTEYETRREINRAGMRGEFFRWNDSPEKLKKYDGYVIGGGFSYEDRSRAGVIASLDPIMQAVKEQAARGKPVLGICNGAQILLESGLVPGVDGNKLAMALARNKRTKDGEVLGTGYYNAWTHLKCTARKGTCMFTRNIPEGEILRAPIAHGEGRFTTEIPDLIPKLQDKGLLVFRYCDNSGVITENFPTNPNGSIFSIAAICNPSGNVMAVMPHLERNSASSQKMFASMRDAMIAKKSAVNSRTPHLNVKTVSSWPIPAYEPQSKTMQFFVSLKITDNEAETCEMALKNLGWPDSSLKRLTHFEIEFRGKPDLQKLAKKLIQSGVLLNTNKESVEINFPKERLTFDAKKQKFLKAAVEQAERKDAVTKRFLVREKQDFTGLAKLSAIQKRLKMEEVVGVKIGILWEIAIPTKSEKVAEENLKKIAQTHLFFNPHRQSAALL